MHYIETERLILRHFTDKDANALFTILSDEDVNKFLPMFPLKKYRRDKNIHSKQIHGKVHPE